MIGGTLEKPKNSCLNEGLTHYLIKRWIKLVELVKSGNVIITSYTLPWLAPQSLKFWLKGSLSNRAKRMANRDNIAVDTAVEIIQERDIENTGIYRKWYGFEFGSDLSVFDFILNTDLLCLDSLIEISKSIIREIVI